MMFILECFDFTEYYIFYNWTNHAITGLKNVGKCKIFFFFEIFNSLNISPIIEYQSNNVSNVLYFCLILTVGYHQGQNL